MIDVKRERITAVILVVLLAMLGLASYQPVTSYVDTTVYEQFLNDYYRTFESQNAAASQSFWLQPEDGGYMTVQTMERILSLNHLDFQTFLIEEVEILPISLGRKVRIRINMVYTQTINQDRLIDLVWLRGRLFIVMEGPIPQSPS
jgi:hypothetical protein